MAARQVIAEAIRIDWRPKANKLRRMKNEAKAFIIVAAMAGLMTGCASRPPKMECKGCAAGMKSDKVTCGTKGGCSSKGNNGAKGS